MIIGIHLPISNNKTIILHSFVMNDVEYINNIISILKAEGFKEIDVMDFNSFNHFYHKSNVGVYLPDQPQMILPKTEMTLPTVMQTFKCQNKYGTLESIPDMKFSLEVDKDTTQKNDINLNGSYKLDKNGNGYFSTLKGKIYFTLKNTTSKTYLGVRPASILTIKHQEFDVLPKLCSFIVVYENK